MLAKDLAALLLEHPDRDVTVSVDISVGEADAGRRAFGEIIEVMDGNAGTVLIAVGATND